MLSETLFKVLTTSSKIASALDWKKLNGSILSLDIHKDRIGLAIASHPSFGRKATMLENIPLARKGRITKECKERLSALAKDYRVCGLVVSWPVQHDTGRMGASCGRVLHTLDELLQDSTLCTPSRPLCLWDGNHSMPEPEDQWGRCRAYSQTSDKTIHKASEEQYNQDENVVAANIWEDFCQSHWPKLYQQQPVVAAKVEKQSKIGDLTCNSTHADNSNWEESFAYVNAAVL